jgi:hypothetical protein
MITVVKTRINAITALVPDVPQCIDRYEFPICTVVLFSRSLVVARYYT